MKLALGELSNEARVSNLVHAMFAQKGLAAVPPTGSLRDGGLKSVDIVNLMLAVEDEFGLTIPKPQMKIQNFHSVTSIQALVAKLT